MGSGYYGGFIRSEAAALADGYPVDAAQYRDQAASAMHLFDQSAQVRVCWPAKSASTYRTTDSPASTSVWYPITCFGPWNIKIRPASGESFRLRVRLAAAMSAANSGTFRAVLSTPDLASRYANVPAGTAGIGLSYPNVQEASTSSTSAVDLSPTDRYVYLTSAQVAEAMGEVGSFDAVAGATPVGVAGCWVTLSVWAKTSNVAATPRLFAAYAAEVYGT